MPLILFLSLCRYWTNFVFYIWETVINHNCTSICFICTRRNGWRFLWLNVTCSDHKETPWFDRKDFFFLNNFVFWIKCFSAIYLLENSVNKMIPLKNTIFVYYAPDLNIFIGAVVTATGGNLVLIFIGNCIN